jgi:hypothetical protein
MAIRAATTTWRSKRVAEIKWTGLLNGDTGDAQATGTLSDKSIQVLGTFGTGGTVVLEGSNDGGTTWSTLNDTRGEGNALSFTSSDLRQTLENTRHIRPNVTAGDGSTNLTVIVTAASTA